MIPKKLHYVWFGGNQKNELIEKCILSWKIHMPEYEIVQWDENNFDLGINDYVSKAYAEKRWAFVSDFVRLYALREHGGIYLDTDVEVFRSFDDLLDCGAFTGFEKYIDTYSPITAVMGSLPNHPWISELMSEYDRAVFEDGYTNTQRITKDLNEKRGIINNNMLQKFDDVVIYPAEYFCLPSRNGYAVHHFNGSWLSGSAKFKKSLRKLLNLK